MGAIRAMARRWLLLLGIPTPLSVCFSSRQRTGKGITTPFLAGARGTHTKVCVPLAFSLGFPSGMRRARDNEVSKRPYVGETVRSRQWQSLRFGDILSIVVYDNFPR